MIGSKMKESPKVYDETVLGGERDKLIPICDVESLYLCYKLIIRTIIFGNIFCSPEVPKWTAESQLTHS